MGGPAAKVLQPSAVRPVGKRSAPADSVMDHAETKNNAHTLEAGAARYIAGMTGDEYMQKFSSGVSVASPSTCLCCTGGEVRCCPYLGATGPMTDQSKVCCNGGNFTDKVKQAEAARVIRALAMGSPAAAATMER